MSETGNEISQIVIGEERNGAGLDGQVLLDREFLPGVRFTEVSLEITDVNLKIDQWLRVGRVFGHVHRSMNWWIGDWIVKGEALFGHEAYQGVEATRSDRYNEAHRITGLDHQTLLNISSICQNVLRSCRRSELGFWIHQEVSRLEPEEQRHWLGKAVELSWSQRELRAALNQAGLRPGRKLLPEGGDTGASSNGGGDSGFQGGNIARIEQAARRVYHQWQRTRDGSYLVPAEPAAQLIAALGEEDGG